MSGGQFAAACFVIGLLLALLAQSATGVWGEALSKSATVLIIGGALGCVWVASGINLNVSF